MFAHCADILFFDFAHPKLDKNSKWKRKRKKQPKRKKRYIACKTGFFTGPMGLGETLAIFFCVLGSDGFVSGFSLSWQKPSTKRQRRGTNVLDVEINPCRVFTGSASCEGNSMSSQGPSGYRWSLVYKSKDVLLVQINPRSTLLLMVIVYSTEMLRDLASLKMFEAATICIFTRIYICCNINISMGLLHL